MQCKLDVHMCEANYHVMKSLTCEVSGDREKRLLPRRGYLVAQWCRPASGYSVDREALPESLQVDQPAKLSTHCAVSDVSKNSQSVDQYATKPTAQA